MWFKTNKEVRTDLNERELTLISKEADIKKREADSDASIYRREKFLEIDKLAAKNREEIWREVEEVAIQGAKQKGNYEHEWHSGMEKKRTEFAVLEAKVDAKRSILDKAIKIESLVEEVAKYKGESAGKDIVITELKTQLERADENVKVVVGKLSKMEISSVGFTVNAEKK